MAHKVYKIAVSFGLLLLLACNDSSTNATINQADRSKDSLSATLPVNTDTVVSSDTDILPEGNTTIRFRVLTCTFHYFALEERYDSLKITQGDTLRIYPELGSTIEGHSLSITAHQLTNIVVAQRYETSVTIMDEGPHCDLIDWKHFNSEWQQLSANSLGQFICKTYTEKERIQFPAIAMADLRQRVKEKCGAEWLKLIEKIKSPNEYPSAVSISRYFIRITGQKKDNGQTVTKLIIIEMPMGC